MEKCGNSLFDGESSFGLLESCDKDNMVFLFAEVYVCAQAYLLKQMSKIEKDIISE